jgi:hypothetical protein
VSAVRSRRHSRAALTLLPAGMILLVLPALAGGCAGMASQPEAPTPLELPPIGYGTLRQNDVSIDLVSGDLQFKVTPLAESVIRVTAPDTYRRLEALAEQYRPEALRRSGADTVSLFLVSAYSESPDVPFVPEDIQLISKGARMRPAAIVPVSAGWQQRRLRQRHPEMAVYAFAGGVDLESDLIVAYGPAESSAWDAILPQVRAERARVRARAAGGGRRSPSPER